MRLYASTFISLALAFLGFLGAKNESILELPSQNPIHFSNILKDPALSRNTEKPVIEIFDALKCKACDTLILGTLPKLQEALKDKNTEIKVIFVPDKAIPDQTLAAHALKCAAEQNRYLDYLKSLHEDETGLSTMGLAIRAQKLDLKVVDFKQCLTTERHGNEIAVDLERANTVMLTQRPTILVAPYRLLGAQPLENILRALRQ